MAGTSGRSYVLEMSGNLKQWTPVSTNSTPFVFEDAQAAGLAIRFYRAVSAD